MIKEMLAEIYSAKDMETARARKDEAMEFMLENAPKTAELLDEAFDDITAVMALPLKYRKKLRTSNSIERVNEEVRRRERVIRIFPSEDSVMRILGSVLIDVHEGWENKSRSFDMFEYHETFGRSIKRDSADEALRSDVA